MLFPTFCWPHFSAIGSKPSGRQEAITKMVTANPDSADAYVLRARFYLSDKDPAEQFESLPEEIKSLVKDAKSPAERLEILQKDLLQKATADCEKARELDPKDANALQVYAECIEMAAGYEPTLAGRLAKYGQVRAALEELIKAKPLAPQLYLQLSQLELKIGSEAAQPDSGQTARAAAIAAIRRGLTELSKDEERPPHPDQTFELRWQLANLLIGDRSQADELDALMKQLVSERPDLSTVKFLQGRRLVADQNWRRRGRCRKRPAAVCSRRAIWRPGRTRCWGSAIPSSGTRTCVWNWLSKRSRTGRWTQRLALS